MVFAIITAMPTISVLTPTHNRSRSFIESCIRSVSNQQGASVTQHIVIDNASTDNTMSHLTGLMSIYPHLVILHSNENLGPGGALNFALSHVTSDYIWPLDDDDMLILNGLRVQSDFLNLHPDTDMLIGYAEPIDEMGAVIVGSTISGFNNMAYDDDNEAFFRAHLAANQLKNGTVIFRTSSVRELGGWHSLNSCQDWELSLNVLFNNKKHRRNPKIVSRYRIHSHQLSSINGTNGVWAQKAVDFQLKYGGRRVS